jgi:hypothetical protein
MMPPFKKKGLVHSFAMHLKSIAFVIPEFIEFFWGSGPACEINFVHKFL